VAKIGNRRSAWVVIAGSFAMAIANAPLASAQPPAIDLSGGRARVRIKASQLSEAIDALARAAGFKVTYDGARPSAMLYNAEIDTATVPQTLFRLLEGQNVNYGVVFDKTGQRVTTLLIVGVAAKSAGGSSGRPQSFPTPRASRVELPPVDDDPVEPIAEPEPSPEVSPSPNPSPAQGPRPYGPPGSPFPPSPFGPRPPGFNPPRPSPTPSP
jgi:hypothetical protein